MAAASSPSLHPSVSQRLPIALGVLLALQLVLLLLMSSGESPLKVAPPDALLLTQPLEGVDRVVIVGPEERTVTLRRSGEGWQLPDYFAAPADAERIEPLLRRLATVQRGRPVATSEAAPARFKVSEQVFERRVELLRGDQSLATLYLGESPGLRQSYARGAEDDAVYAVRLAAYEFPLEASGWLDPTLLALDPAQIRELDLGEGIRLRRAGESWEAEGLAADERFDPAAAEALAMRLGGLRVDGLLGRELPEALRGAVSALSFTARTERGESRWTLWKRGEDDGYVVHRSDLPWYAELAEWSAAPLLEAAARPALLREQPEEPPRSDELSDAERPAPSADSAR